jgi:hypothetical protein
MKTCNATLGICSCIAKVLLARATGTAPWIMAGAPYDWNNKIASLELLDS